MQPVIRYKISILGIAASLLSGCSVYAPMLPAAPQIRDKGQVEVHGTSFLNRRWEAGATYSPAKYVLVRAAGGLRTDRHDSVYTRNRQYELAAGGYYPLGRHWLVSGLAGYGQARSSRAYWEGGSPSQRFDGDYYEFAGRYHRLFAELAASFTDNGFTLGLAGRLTDVRYDRLTYNGQPIGLRHLPRLEPMVFCQFGRPEGAVPWLRGQLAVGGSVARPANNLANLSYAETQIWAKVPYLAVSAIILPHLFSRKKQPAASISE